MASFGAAPPGARILTPSQFAADLRHQMEAWKPEKKRRFLRKVVGQVMQTQVIVRFLRGGFRQSGDWKSTAAGEKQLQGRWSAKYKIRPSGDAVTADKIRMVDTRELGNSYRVLEASENHVTVGPGMRAHGGAGPEIAEVQEKAGNSIVGFSDETMTALDAEVQHYLDRIANGEEPPYLPKSNLGRTRASV